MRKALALAVLALLALAGCRQAPPTFHFKCTAFLPEVDQYRLLVDGRPFATFAGEQEREFELPGRAAGEPRDMLPVITAEVPYVCGWRHADVRVSEPRREEIEAARREKRPVPAFVEVSFSPPSFADAVFYVDNRGGPAGTLSLGALDRPVAAGLAQRISLPFWPGCEQARQLRLNGELLLTLPAANWDKSHSFLLDPTGKRCYHEESRTYGEPFYRPPYIQKLAPQRVQELPEDVDYFLEPLPGSVMSEYSIASKSTLLEGPCR
jgi:hypothetical protein